MNRKIFVIAVITLFLDQITKVIISLFFNDLLVILPDFFSLEYTKNYGAAWSIFNYKVEFLIFISLIALIILFRYLYSFKLNLRNNIAFGLLFGGICGNLIDRLFIGFVRDFLSFKFFNYHFPIFNLADTCIVMGVLLLIIAIFKGEDKLANNSK